MTDKILIYRNQLFKPSEVFIKAQAQALKTLTPVFAGTELMTPNNTEALPVFLCRQKPKLYQRLLPSHTGFAHLPDVKAILSHFTIDTQYILPWAIKHNKPVYCVVHGFDVARPNRTLLLSGKPAWMRYVVKQQSIKRHTRKFLCVSQHIKNLALKRGFPEEKLVVHYLGIDLAPDYQRDIDDIQNKRFLHIGRLVEKKGTAELIRAVALARKNGADIYLDIAGSGPLESQLKELVKHLKLQDCIAFKGHSEHDELMRLIPKYAAVVVPSVTASDGDTEGLPTVQLESMARAVPIVGTYHAGIPEACTHRQTGLLSDERDVTQLAENLSYMAENPEEAITMGQNGLKLAHKKFDRTKQNAVLEKMILDDAQ